MAILVTLLSLFVTILIFSFLIIVHELGHMIVAKMNGIAVDAFGVGFGPKIISKTYKGTEYRLNVIPLGGYVQMRGDEDPSSFKQDKSFKDDPKSFQSKEIWRRIAVVIAGPAVNFVIAIIIFYFYLGFVGFQPEPIAKVADYNFVGAEQQELLIYAATAEDGAAAAAGMPDYGFFVDINDEEFNSRDEFVEILNKYENEAVDITIMNEDREISTYKVQLAEKAEDGNVKLGVFIDFDDSNNPNSFYFIDYGDNKVLSGFLHTFHITGYQVLALGEVIGNAFQGEPEQLVDNVATPVKIGEVVYYQVSAQDIGGIINLTALISATLAFMNMLPIPLVDGGQIYLMILEKLRGKPLPDKVQNALGIAGFVFLIGIGVIFLLKDIWQVIIGRIF